MKGLRLNEIESIGFDLHGKLWRFNRYYLSEHPVLPKVSYFRGNYNWYPGKIIEVFRSQVRAEKAFRMQAGDYLTHDINFT